MTDIYNETIIISCDRESAQTKQDDGLNSTWTNTFNNTLKLEAGDRVSVYNSFVSERGSATTNSVEFKGVSLGQTKKIKYSTITPTTYTPPGSLVDAITYQETISEVQEDQEIFDNKCAIVINYYKTTDGLSNYHLPRRYIKNNDAGHTSSDNSWFKDDSIVMGRVNREASDVFFVDSFNDTNYVQEEQKFGLVDDDYTSILDENANTVDGVSDVTVRQGRVKRWILRNNNERYTIMARKKTIMEDFFTFDKTDINNVIDTYPADWDAQFPPYYAREPEYFDYVIYREKLELEVSPGFNSAEFIASDLTRQLQQTDINEPESQRNTFTTNIPGGGGTVDQVITQETNLLLKSKCYKPFNSSNDYYQTSTNFKGSLDNTNPPGVGAAGQEGISGPTEVFKLANPPAKWNVNNKISSVIEGRQVNPTVDYYQTYQYIGCKRPEIYDAGTKLNDIFGFSLITKTPAEGDYAHYLQQGLILKLQYNETNLQKLKTFIESQEKYPELFKPKNIKLWSDVTKKIGVGYTPEDEDDPSANPYTDATYQTVHINENNARFLHMNDCLWTKLNNSLDSDDLSAGESYVGRIPLGNSYYNWRGNGINLAGNVLDKTTFSRTLTEKCQSRSFFFAYDPAQRDTYYETPLGDENYVEGVTSKKLTYGAFGKTNVNGVDYIMVFPNVLQGNRNILNNYGYNVGNNIGIPPTFFSHLILDGTHGVMDDNGGQKIGFDRHWNAWGTACISLTTGIPEYSFNNPYPGTVDPPGSTNYDGTTTQYGYSFPDINSPEVALGGNPSIFESQGKNIQVSNNKQYLGADTPTISYDGNHFNFTNLHTPLNKGNLDELNVAPSGDEATLCYKINPTQKYNNWSPVQFPYEELVKFNYVPPTGGTNTQNDSYTRMNRNLSPFTIYDTTTGIFIEDFGYNDKTFDDGIWGRLGFEKKQLYSGVVKSDRNTRMGSSVVNTNILTTNVAIDTVDSKSWSQDKFYNSFHDGSICKAYQFFGYDLGQAAFPGNWADKYLKFLPEIIIQPVFSNVFTGNDYPVQLDNGYYGIRSDLLTNSINAMGDGNVAYPLVAIASKTSDVKDFYVSSPGAISHTITKPKILSSITTKIVDPNGSPARCSSKSVIVYRIEKTRRTSFDIVEDMRRQIEREEAEKNLK